jgi:hypothetical protein
MLSFLFAVAEGLVEVATIVGTAAVVEATKDKENTKK